LATVLATTAAIASTAGARITIGPKLLTPWLIAESVIRPRLSAAS
jgi:hypothetical protein